MMQLYYFETPNPRKPCAVAKYLNSPVEWIRIDLAKGENRSPEFLKVNPNAKVPAFRHGELRLWESHAIMAYLALQANSALWPQEPIAQIDIMRWLQWDIAHFSRHSSTFYYQNVIKTAFDLGDPDQEALDEATGFFHRFAKVLDDHLVDNEYLVGGKLSIADFGVACTLPDASPAKIPVEGYKKEYSTLA